MPSKYLKVALEAAKKAETVLLHYYKQKNLEVSLKGDQSPVTLADKEAEEVIINIIKNSFPDHNFLGEESGNTNKDSEFTWIIDPIDGTKAFTRKMPLFATEIALIKGNNIILGISNAPLLKELLYAEIDSGAFLNDQPTHVSKVKTIPQAYLCHGGLKYFQRTNLIDNLISLSSQSMGFKGLSDFWGFHLLATGKTDAMIEAQTKTWDIAALTLIIEEAGGKITDIKGKKIDLSNHASSHTKSLLATNGLIHQALLEYFH